MRTYVRMEADSSVMVVDPSADMAGKTPNMLGVVHLSVG